MSDEKDKDKITLSVNRRASEEFRRGMGETFGLPISVVSDEEAENAALVVCTLASSEKYFNDDVFTVCADCGIAIKHRPHAPKKPRKVCMRCAMINIELHRKETT